MVKISPGTIKEAAKNINELLESSSPEIKMLLDNPHFATGLCLVLHREVVQLRNQIQEMQESSSQMERPELPNQKPSRQERFPNTQESDGQSSNQQDSPKKQRETQADKEELFV
jgi:hypothetical protein